MWELSKLDWRDPYVAVLVYNISEDIYLENFKRL